MTNKVGILNFQYSEHNYGAVLQAAALESSIKELGYHAEHINFIPVVQNSSTFWEKLKRKLVAVKVQLSSQKKPLQKVHNKVVFEEFRKNWLTRTPRVYNTLAELQTIKDVYATVVVGSDQVWRPLYTQNNAMAYFFSFVSTTCRRVSYAASFGVDYWASQDDIKLTSAIKTELKKFNAISVRESSAVTICKDVFDVDAIHVLDPTLLIGRHFFDQIISESSHSKPTADIVYYKLDINEEFIKDTGIIAEKYAYTIENIYHKNIGGEWHYNPVAEWLEKLRESKLVITDSFHCVCFSILFGKQFIYYPNDARGMSRLESLLSALNLTSRICHNTTEFSSTTLVDDKIDYLKVNTILEGLQHKSKDFLQKALAS
jgi:hypothetical protein